MGHGPLSAGPAHGLRPIEPRGSFLVSGLLAVLEGPPKAIGPEGSPSFGGALWERETRDDTSPELFDGTTSLGPIAWAR